MDAYTVITIVIFAYLSGRETSASTIGFSVSPKDKLVGLNTNVSLPCGALGNGKLFWTKKDEYENVILTPGNGTELNVLPPNAQGRYHVDSNGNLWIRNTTNKDSGVYMCVAVYPKDAIHTSASLKVIDLRLPRYAPSNVSAVKVDNKFILVSWEPPKMEEDQSPISGYELKIVIQRESLNDPKEKIYHPPADRNYVVLPLEISNRKLWVEMAAINEYGPGPYNKRVVIGAVSWSALSVYRWMNSKPNITHVNETHVTLEWMPLKTYQGRAVNSYSLHMFDERKRIGRSRVYKLKENRITVRLNRDFPKHYYYVRIETNSYDTTPPRTETAELNTGK